MDAELEARARRWLEDDPDAATRAELDDLLRSDDGEAVAERFRTRLTFGTAGIRGPLGAGPARMNRALARRVAVGLATHLADMGTAESGVVVGRDARLRSDDLATDVAAVLAGAGVPVVALPAPVPTPVLAYAVTKLHCAAGVMVTASHNPPADNGLKLFGADGAQIAAPTDASISAAIDRVDAVRALPLGEPRLPSVDPLDAYLTEAAALVRSGPRGARVVHTALHGVGAEPLRRLFVLAGFAAPHPVAAQAVPDGRFPTVAYPNPEEPGALDLALAEAARVGADVVLANDPDADRLAMAVPDRGRWRVLTGDELGVLLADHVLSNTSGDDRLVASTVVSSTMLGRLAAAHGVHHAVTLTGFKWLMRAAEELPGTRFVFGYEEALGYAVGDLVRDKDGLTAALVAAALVAELLAAGKTVAGRLEELARQHGLHATRQWSVRAADGAEGARRLHDAVERVAKSPPRSLGGRALVDVERPAADVVVMHLEDAARAVIRPSGTEPKLKCYLQIVVDEIEPGTAGWEAAQDAASTALEELRQGLAAEVGLAH